MVKIVKRKLRGFFKPKDLIIIKQAVLEHNEVMTKVSMLARAYYLFQIEKDIPYQEIVLDFQLLELCCSIVKGKGESSTKKSNKQLKDNATDEQHKKFEKDQEKSLENKVWKKNVTKTLDSLYIQLFGENRVTSTCSISTSLDYSCKNLITAYENNIVAHFPKYVKKMIICDQMKQLMEMLATVEVNNKTLQAIKNKMRKNAAILSNYLVYENKDALNNLEDIEGITIDIARYKNLLPAKKLGKESYPYCYHLAAYPMTFLPYMVQIDRQLETDYPNVDEKTKKLYNPIPFHSSNVPMHMRLDTSAIAQLLMTSKRIEKFKEFYETKHPLKKLNMKNKSDMLSSYKKLFGMPATSKREEGEYATELWNFLSNLETCKQRKFLYCKYKNSISGKMEEHVFDNSIVTDGVSISLQITKLSEFGRKDYNSNGNPLKLAAAKILKEVKINNDETVQEIIIDKMKKLLSCDPGKCDIATITDGIKTIAYTRGQRDQDTFMKSKNLVTLKKRRKSGLEVYETTVLNKFPKNSCTLKNFSNYCYNREVKKKFFDNTYNHPYFRESKFTTYCQLKSSEDKFIRKIVETFSKPNTEYKNKNCLTQEIKDNAAIACSSKSDLAIAWGNWGKNPNALRNGAPTPGVGIRRRFEKHFQISVVSEHMSSQTCPCCGAEKTMKNPEIKDVTRHHLLRCTNDCDSSWWNRNVLGSFNILVNALAITKRITILPGDETSRIG